MASTAPGSLPRRASLDMLARHLRRDSDLFAREPSMLGAQVHNSLWLDEGSREGADVLIRRAREGLAGHSWLQLRNRPPVTRAPILRTASHGGCAWALAWHPSAATLASGGSDGWIRLWAGGDARLLDVLDAGRGSVKCLASSPDGTILASGTRTVPCACGRPMATEALEHRAHSPGRC